VIGISKGMIKVSNLAELKKKLKEVIKGLGRTSD